MAQSRDHLDVQLTTRQKAIIAEEEFRKTLTKREDNGKLYIFFNSPIVLWIISAIFLSAVPFVYNIYNDQRLLLRSESLIKAEIYNRLQQSMLHLSITVNQYEKDLETYADANREDKALMDKKLRTGISESLGLITNKNIDYTAGKTAVYQDFIGKSIGDLLSDYYKTVGGLYFYNEDYHGAKRYYEVMGSQIQVERWSRTLGENLNKSDGEGIRPVRFKAYMHAMQSHVEILTIFKIISMYQREQLVNEIAEILKKVPVIIGDRS